MGFLRAVVGTSAFRFVYSAVLFAAGAYLFSRDDLIFPIVGGLVFATAIGIAERRRNRAR